MKCDLRQTRMMTSARSLFLCASLLIATLCIRSADAADGLRISWTNNLLTVSAPDLPGKTLDIWYLEAFCRKGSTHQDWNKTTIPHKTTLLEAHADGKRLKLLTAVTDGVEMTHVLRARADEIDITYEMVNRSSEESQ